MPTTNVSPRVADILNRVTIQGMAVHLPAEQLPRPLYEEVDKVLRNAGGKWNRSQRAHLFETDPAPILAEALGTGKSVDQKQVKQAFYTPPALAEMITDICGVSRCTVLEPSAGDGRLVVAAFAAGARSVTAVENDQLAAKRIPSHSALEVEVADFLEWRVAERFDRVLMNPPFTRNQDVMHVRHALNFLKPGGRLVSVMAGNTSRSPFLKLLEAYPNSHFFELPENSFKASGTLVRTICLTINKP